MLLSPVPPKQHLLTQELPDISSILPTTPRTHNTTHSPQHWKEAGRSHTTDLLYHRVTAPHKAPRPI